MLKIKNLSPNLSLDWEALYKINKLFSKSVNFSDADRNSIGFDTENWRIW